MKLEKIFLLITILFLFSIPFISAETFGYNSLEEGTNLNPSINYSTVNVNNSQYFQSYTPTTLKDWIQGLFDSIYCELTGCTMEGNINMGGNDLINAGNITSSGNTHRLDVNVGNQTLTLDSGGIAYSCIELLEAGTFGFTICNDGAGTNRLVFANYEDGYEWFWIDRDTGEMHFMNNTNFTNVHVTTINITGDLTGIGANLSYLYGAEGIGGIDMRGDPWWFSGADWEFASNVEIDENLNVSGNITAPWFNGKFNWTTGDDWNSFDGSSLTFNDSKLATTYYNASTIQAVAGTYVGTIVDTQHPDGDYDGVTLNLTETAGGPGLDMRFNFSASDLNKGYMRYETSNLQGDSPVIQLWDYNDLEWEGGYGEIDEATSEWATLSGDVLDSSDHIQDGVVQMRLYKSANGNTQNKYYIDMLTVVDGYATPSGNVPLGDYWKRDGGSTATGNFNLSNYNLTADRLTASSLNITGTLYTGAFNPNNLTITGTEGLSLNVSGDLYVNASSGKVGIGTTAPGAKLEIVGTGVTDSIGLRFTDTGQSVLAQFIGESTTDADHGRALQLMTTGETYARSTFYTNGAFGMGPGNATRDVFLSRSAANTFRISSDMGGGSANLIVNGNVGIGTTAPSQKLHISGDSGTQLYVTGPNAYSAESGILLSSGRAKIVGQLEASGGTPGTSLQFYTMPTNGAITEGMRITNTGKVGIGTTSPGNMLHVMKGDTGNTVSPNAQMTLENDGTTQLQLLSGTGNYQTILFDDDESKQGAIEYYHGDDYMRFYTNGSEILRLASDGGAQFKGSGNSYFTGNVGIGTTNPQSVLQVSKTLNSAIGGEILIDNPGGNAGAGGRLAFYRTGSVQPYAASIQSIDDGAYGYHMSFNTKTTGAAANTNTERMRITSDGNVGIGTTSPLYPLTVAKNTSEANESVSIWASGNISASGFIDRTPAFIGTTEQALNSLINIQSKDGEIDHSTLPDFARVHLLYPNTTYEEEEYQEQEIKEYINESYIEEEITYKDKEFFNEETNETEITQEEIKTNVTKYREVPVYENVTKTRTIEVVTPIESEGRSLGSMITLIVEAIKELVNKDTELENKILKMEKTLCEEGHIEYCK